MPRLFLLALFTALAAADAKLRYRPKPRSHALPVHHEYMNEVAEPKKCPRRLSKISMIQRSWKARQLQKATLPDPQCKTGVASLELEVVPARRVGAKETPSGANTKACCPAYCGECSDYPNCKSMNGQNSEFRCCASKVLSKSCSYTRTPANECVKSCAEAVPPCVMNPEEEWVAPAMTSAAEDCNNAVVDWMTSAQSSVEGVPSREGGPDGVRQWADYATKTKGR